MPRNARFAAPVGQGLTDLLCRLVDLVGLGLRRPDGFKVAADRLAMAEWDWLAVENGLGDFLVPVVRCAVVALGLLLALGRMARFDLRFALVRLPAGQARFVLAAELRRLLGQL